MTGCRFVHDHQAEHAVKDLCRVIDLPRSTYYAWLKYQPSQRAWDDNVLLSEIKDIHVLSRHTYGAPRILGQLRHRGHRVGRHRVARIMVEHGLVGVHGRKKWRRGKSDTAYAPDLLERDFSATRPTSAGSRTSRSSTALTANSSSPASATSSTRPSSVGRWENDRRPIWWSRRS